MYNFKIGQRVVCIDSWKQKDPTVIYPVKGKIYTIRGFCFDEIGDLFLVFDEIINDLCTWRGITQEHCFWCVKFRPLVEDGFADSVEAYIKEKVKEELLEEV